MSPDRRPLGLAFSEPAVDQALPAGERPIPLPAERSPFLEPDTDTTAPPTARRTPAQRA
ncbi:hypothetical protein [Kitasatospora phosalacinea]|uniref:Uncharacterized protein n=1 Tax=Kitasatospora phosalacinea TaxID=2065 RepID=A0A9W6PKS3_9ACTN|nr:hypothetical protein [Kitasatospora phosalacinea]GLW58134.1 hypothetical protein Kpho01_61450 [Kitasatospora phosalacinea]